MKITDIKQQAKRRDRYSIFIDGKYSFPLSESELLAQALKTGDELTSADLHAMKDISIIDKGVYRVLDLISRRARSRWEVQDYLRKKGYSPEKSEKIIRRIDDKGYINDLEFSKKWIENRRLLKASSNRKLHMELRQKRVDENIIKLALEDDPVDEKATIKELIERKRGQSRYQDNQKLTAYLVRQGFNYGDIKETMDSLQ